MCSIAFAVVLMMTVSVSNAAMCTSNTYLTVTEGRCAWMTSGATASTDGVWVTLGNPSNVVQGDTTSSSGLILYGCGVATQSDTEQVDRTFFATPGSVPETVSAGVAAPSSGIACGQTCSVQSVSQAATAASTTGVFIPDASAITVTSGTPTQSNGFFCSGCTILASTDTAPAAGTVWQYSHASGSAISQGHQNPFSSSAMFCPNLPGGSASGANKVESKISIVAVVIGVSLLNFFAW